ncbi:uncharacterized protein V1516DRAFT_666213 [Lipomyces oligophaga]|uniref:uncharacterized protein n=1 Tax=Lipomyces oligophaga TaxID=45792 RepID=UPI0034CF37EE
MHLPTLTEQNNLIALDSVYTSASIALDAVTEEDLVSTAPVALAHMGTENMAMLIAVPSVIAVAPLITIVLGIAALNRKSTVTVNANMVL